MASSTSRLVDAHPYPTWVFDQKTLRIMDANAAALKRLGYSRRELLARTIAELRPPEQLPRLYAGLKDPKAPGYSKEQMAAFICKDGSIFEAAVRRVYLRHHGRPATLVAARDLSDDSEVELARSEERFRLLVDTVADYVICMVDPHGLVRTWNEGGRRVAGYRAEEIVGRPYSLLFSDGDRRRGVPASVLHRALRAGSSSDRGLRRHKDGTLYPQEGVTMALRDPKKRLLGYLRVSRDRSEQDQDRRTIGLARDLVRASELERKRVARELHDGVNQLLAAALMRLRSAADPRIDGEKAVADAAAILESAIAEIRRISADLRPAALDELGLVAALRSLTVQFSRPGGPKVSFAGARLPEIDPMIELTAYRVVQEALHNVLKHAGAKRAKVKAEVSEGVLRIEVADDGRGFAPSARGGDDKRGAGLGNMRERCEAVGGRFEITSARGAGTSVRLEIPLDGKRSSKK